MKTNFNLFLLAIFLAAIVLGWDWPYIAKLMPVYVAAVPGLILILVQIYRDASGWEASNAVKSGGIEMDEVYDVKLDKAVETRRTLLFFGWFVGGALGIWLLGIVIALPFLVFLYGLIEGREGWLISLLMSLCTYALVWGLFEYLLDARWPSGLLFQ